MTLRTNALQALTSMIITALGAGCAAAPSDEAATDEAAQSEVNPLLFRENAPWTGRLVLPSAAERRPDGAVKIEIHNSPDASLRGQTVWLRFADADDVRQRARSVTRSVVFDDATRKSMAKGNIHPVRIDGWKDVAPLESLAGARKDDDVLVALPTAQRQGADIFIRREPVMIAGDYVGLVTIKAAAGNGAYKVAHYHKVHGDFSGPEQTLAFDAAPFTVAGIEGTSSNRLSGFYVHAVREADGQLHVRGLVPRSLRSVPTVNMRNGASASLLYTTAGMWDPIADAAKGRQAKGTSSSMLLVPDGNAGEARALAWQQRALAVGTRLLVTHSFGAIGPAEDGVLRTGHFAFGVGTIAVEPLTGERVVDVEYRQIYAHNPNGIIAGAHDYASYAGSFARGWLYARPLADVALHVPALDRDYSLGGASFGAPIDVLALELEAMAARYRTGLGTGAAIVTPANSCVQDSSKALYFALAKLQERASRPEVKTFLAAHPDDPEVQDFGVLVQLGTKVERYLSPLGFTRSDWKNQVDKLAATDVNACPGGILGAAFCGLASFGTVTPRRASDFYTEALILAGGGGIAIRSNDLGDATPGTFPLSPTTLFH